MTHAHILLVGTSELLPQIPSAFETPSGRRIVAELASAVSEAVELVARRDFDVVLCWVERPDELTGVLRIRKARTDLPIVAVTEEENRDFDRLAREAGATRTARVSRSAESLLRLMALILEKEIKSLAEDARDLIREHRSGRSQPATFIPLLVEDSPDDALMMVRAFEKADVYAPLPIMKSGEETIAFLSEADPYVGRSSRFPSPTIVLLDVHLPGKSGLDVLEWIRKDPNCSRLPVLMLSASTDPAHINRSYCSGANSYLIKPTQQEALVELVAGLKRYWGSVNLPSL